METKFADTTVTFQFNQPTAPMQSKEVNEAVIKGIDTHIKFLKIKDKTTMNINNTVNPKIVRS